MKDKLGSRAWDIVQGVIVASIVVSGLRGPKWPRLLRLPLRLAALAAAVPGAWLLVGGGTGLGSQLRTEPEPVPDGTLKREGVFGVVRHPMYGGVTFLLGAWTLATSPLALVPWAGGGAYLAFKVRREEELLRAQYPDYDEYAADVPKRFIPYVF